jgi:DNA-binding transcriptional LysR family regulator
LIGENFDLAIRMGDLRDDASLAARKIAVFSVSLYAAPSYLARRGIAVRAGGADGARRAARPRARRRCDAVGLLRGDERWEGMPPGRATANSPELLMRMALGGAGITVVNDHFAHAPAARRARPGAARLAPASGQRVGGVSRRR